jgi:hypothetical protein
MNCAYLFIFQGRSQVNVNLFQDQNRLFGGFLICECNNLNCTNKQILSTRKKLLSVHESPNLPQVIESNQIKTLCRNAMAFLAEATTFQIDRLEEAIKTPF